VKITITLDPAEDGAEAVYAFVNAGDIFEAIRDYSERLRQAQKYAADDAAVRNAGPGYFRELLYKVLDEHGVTLEA
jgi:hypothetical protein